MGTFLLILLITQIPFCLNVAASSVLGKCQMTKRGEKKKKDISFAGFMMIILLLAK